MRYGLGIDTGGTYTDAVVYDFEKGRVIASAKSITIKEDLKKGIDGAIEKLPDDFLKNVGLVSLSTTLATNACVEGKGSRAKLVMIGCDEEISAKYGGKYGLPETGEMIFLGGGHDQQGKAVSEPDWDVLKARVDECRNLTDAYAVVELWGVRNPYFEKKAKELIYGWTGLPVVCGCELTDEINSLRRAASALLNAQLIPIINQFLNAVKMSMVQKCIDAPLVIVRGDGSLMSEDFARSKPVETLLCGPAASIAGGIGLSGERNCIIIDMGGTTSDIAVVRDGIPRVASMGASIGKWRTGTRSVHINTVGLGGDSLIRHTSEDRLAIGPVRAAPLSWAADRWPGLAERIKRISENKKRHSVSLCEFLYLVRDISEDPFYSSEERDIAGALREGPMSIAEIAKKTGSSVYDIRTRKLEQHGAVMRCGLTPTDVMHLTGEYAVWSRDAALYGATAMANQINTSLDELIAMVNEQIREKLFFHIAGMLLEDKDENLMKGGISSQLNNLLVSGFREKRKALKNEAAGNDFVSCRFAANAVLVGIGAPAHIYLPDVAKVLDTDCIIPENAGVANAIGAITGNVMAEEKVLIRPQYAASGLTGYIGFSSLGNREFKRYGDALEWAEASASEMAEKSASERGAGEVELSVSVNNVEAEISSVYMDDKNGGVRAFALSDQEDFEKVTEVFGETIKQSGNKMLLETVVTARASGRMKWSLRR